MMRTVFNEDLRMSFIIAASQLGLHLTTIWNFLKRDVQLWPHKLQKHQEINDLDKRIGIYFYKYGLSELKNNPESFKRVKVSNERIISLLDLSASKPVWYGAWNVRMNISRPHNRPSIMNWCHASKNQVIRPHFLENEVMTGEIYKTFFGVMCSRNV